MPRLNQTGTMPILMTVTVLGLLIAFLVLNTAPLQEQLYETLFPKKNSNASEPTKGALTATPTSCALNADGFCSVTINWDVSKFDNDAKVEIKVGDTLFASGGVKGSAVASGINRNELKFDLFVNGTLYDSLIVRGH